VRLRSQRQVALCGGSDDVSGAAMPAGARMEGFGSGGGASVAANLSTTLEREVPLLAQIPLDPRLREGSDAGTPVVLSSPDSPAAHAFDTLAESLRRLTRRLAGRALSLSPLRSAPSLR